MSGLYKRNWRNELRETEWLSVQDKNINSQTKISHRMPQHALGMSWCAAELLSNGVAYVSLTKSGIWSAQDLASKKRNRKTGSFAMKKWERQKNRNPEEPHSDWFVFDKKLWKSTPQKRQKQEIGGGFVWGKRIGIVSIHLPLPMIPASLFGVIYLLKTKPTLRNNSELADTWFEADNNQPRLPLKNYTFVYLQNNLNPTQKQYPNRTFSRTVMAGISAILARSLITFLT